MRLRIGTRSVGWEDLHGEGRLDLGRRGSWDFRAWMLLGKEGVG